MLENKNENREQESLLNSNLPNNIKFLEGYFETLNTAPTFFPKTFYDSIKIYNGDLYIFDYKTDTWITAGTSGSFLKDAGKGTTLPSASENTDAFYYKTDTDTLYRSNGTAWIAIN